MNPARFTAKQSWIFLGALVVYLLFCWQGQRFHGNAGKFVGDEATYVLYAQELITWAATFGGHEFDTDITMYSGPGFPLYLVPWMLLGFGFNAIKLLNAFLIVGGSIFLFGALKTFLQDRAALLISVLTILHPKLIWHSSMILTEPYAFFLSAVLCWLLLRPNRERSKYSWILTAFVLSQIILTKVLFAYVAVVLIVTFGILRFLTDRKNAMEPMLTCAAALFFCLPFLAHTYTETGKLFYWLHSGGTNLYWMSTPHEDELGDWMGDNLEGLRQRAAEGHVDFVFDNHKDFFQALPTDDAVARDLMFKRAGWENIVSHPAKFGSNVLANVCRIFTDHPNTFENRDLKLVGIVDVVVGVPLLLGTVVFSIVSALNFRQFPTPMLLIFLLFLVFVAGLSLLASFGRMIVPVIPMLVVWMSYTWKRCIDVRWQPYFESQPAGHF